MQRFLPIFALFALLCFPAGASDMGPDSYPFYLEQYAHFSLRAASQDSCLKGIALKKNYSKSMNEKRAADELEKMCRLPITELRMLAANYECGCAGYREDKNLAINIYHYLHRTHGQRDVLNRLKDLGEKVFISPPTPTESKAVDEELKILMDEARKRNLLSPSDLESP